jgi:cobalt-zinc-cadmium efflux system outer membrane protein
MFSEYARPLLVVSMMLIASRSFAQQWTLESSVQQAMSAAPELEKTMAEIGARQAEIELSGMWPDPSIEFRVDNKLGKDDGSGGFDLTDVTISQPIPLSRTKYQQSVAEANLKATEYSREYQALLVQNRVSKVFHQLQLASAELSLAEKRLQLADELSSQSRKNAQGVIVRYLTPLEKMRMTIIREKAHQAASSAEGKYKEALNEFAKLLVVEPDETATVSELRPVDSIPDLSSLFELQDRHAQLSSQQQQLVAATHEIDVARSSQMQDPTISLVRTRDTFSGGRDDVYGIMFNIQIPIHDRKSAAVGKAGYMASQQRIELERMKRELHINLKRSYTHLHHVVEQAADYKEKVLAPAKKMLDLTRKGFSSGELNMLTLVDANNTYFEARLKYLELLYQAWVELADVNLYAGQLIVHVDALNISANAGGQ